MIHYTNLKVALIHDYLIDFGGAERVLLTLHEMYPKAPIYVSIYRPKLLGKFRHKFENAEVRQSWFGKLPFAEKLISPLRFLLPLIWKSFNLKNYDLIISSSSWAVTKGFEKKKSALEICYCHTPPRYLYGYDTSRKFNGIMSNLVTVYSTIVNHFMRIYDFRQAQKVDFFIANSKEVAGRIEKFYRKDARVIYPPIEIPKVVIENHSRGGYYLTGGRMTSAKNFDLIIKTFNKLRLPLKIYGDGVLRKDLKNLSNKTIEFLGKIDDQQLTELYANAKAFIVAQKDEDFGITPIEANSYGCPVIAYRGGGYLESMDEGKTGIFFEEPTVKSLSKAIESLNQLEIKSTDCINHAKKFSKERFKKEMLEFVLRIMY